jgi:hypothetical protein
LNAFNGIKVFAATMAPQRAALGDQIERWLEAMRQKPGFEIVDVIVRQSSDDAFHCLTYIFFYNEHVAPSRPKAAR